MKYTEKYESKAELLDQSKEECLKIFKRAVCKIDKLLIEKYSEYTRELEESYYQDALARVGQLHTRLLKSRETLRRTKDADKFLEDTGHLIAAFIAKRDLGGGDDL